MKEIQYHRFSEQDIALMCRFTDDVHTQYHSDHLLRFLRTENAHGFIARLGQEVVGFAYGYELTRPDGRKDFYLHAVDVIEKHQGQGLGTGLVSYVKHCAQAMGCRKLFLITGKGNKAACRCYEKTGGISKADDDVVYTYFL
ncbi:MAG: GNAT family N-acetyltransferase [Clostridiales bacterium]|nr:GNAT family N-acetyltransferase [Clostridiales bacterium]